MKLLNRTKCCRCNTQISKGFLETRVHTYSKINIDHRFPDPINHCYIHVRIVFYDCVARGIVSKHENISRNLFVRFIEWSTTFIFYFLLHPCWINIAYRTIYDKTFQYEKSAGTQIERITSTEDSLTSYRTSSIIIIWYR